MKSIFIINTWLIWLLTAAVGTVQAQWHQPYRLEREVKPSEEDITVVSMNDQGLAIVRNMNEYNHGMRKWLVEAVDTTLQTTWSVDMELESRLTLVGFEFNQQHLYLLYRDSDTDMYNLTLVNVDVESRLYQIDKIKFELNFKLTHFTVAGRSALFGGYISNEPAVLLYNQSSDTPKVLPGLFIRDITLLDIRANQNQSFNVLMAERKGKEEKNLVIRTYDQDGNLLIDDVIDFNPKLSILSGITSMLELDEIMILGTYGHDNERQALGFYSVMMDPFNKQTITYTDLASLEHSLDYLAPTKASKIKAKAQKQKSLGRLPDFKAHINPVRILERKDGFYLLAEMHDQSSSFDSYPYSPYYYSPYYGYYGNGISPFSTRNYPGYVSPYPYSSSRSGSVTVREAMVIQFGLHGEMVKDVSLKIQEVKQPTVEQVSDFIIAGDSIVMAYKKESDIFHSGKTGEDEVDQTTNQIRIKLMDQYDALRNNDDNEGRLRFWYNQQFYVWGFQTIKNLTREGDHFRHVFYVNRISLQ